MVASNIVYVVVGWNDGGYEFVCLLLCRFISVFLILGVSNDFVKFVNLCLVIAKAGNIVRYF